MSSESMESGFRQRVLRLSGVGLLMLLAALPMRIYWRMAFPEPIPKIVLPVPNGYDTLVRAGQLLRSPILDDPDTSSVAELRTEVKKYHHVYDLVQVGLAQKCQVPLSFDSYEGNLDMGKIQAFRQLTRAILGAAKVARTDKKYGEAARLSCDIVRLGFAGGNGGLKVDALIGHTIEKTGLHPLWKISADLSSRECREAIDVLLLVDGAWEPPDEIVVRDRIWSEHVMGWNVRLDNALTELCESGSPQPDFVVINARGLQTLRRLVMVQLAVQSFDLDNARLPADIHELVPKYLPEVPVDMLGNRLIYRPEADKYLIYSLGPNGIDDGGLCLSFENRLKGDVRGDLFIESFFNDP